MKRAFRCSFCYQGLRGGAIYLVLGIACLLMGVLLLVDHIRKEREEKAKKQDAAGADKE